MFWVKVFKSFLCFLPFVVIKNILALRRGGFTLSLSLHFLFGWRDAADLCFTTSQ
jgi:hypothetical protein